MSTTTNVKQTKLNIMTQSQYNSATKNANELYMITDAAINYNDLINKPTIPTAISDLTDDTATYPIDKADYATSAGTLGSSDVGSATTPIYLDNGVPTACSSAIPTQASDIGAQETLVSGTNIKTINNTSVLGNGNIETLNNNQITNCILEAPNGIFSTSGRTITLKAGLKVLISNGRNTNYTYKNTEYTLPSDVSVTYSSYSTGQRRMLFLTSSGTLANCSVSRFLGCYKYKSQLPSEVGSTYDYYAYAEHENYWYLTTGSATANWQEASVIPIFAFYTNDTGFNINRAYSNPIKLADSNMVDGQWTNANTRLANGVTAPTSTADEYDLSDILPKDAYNYEVLVSSSAATGTTSGNTAIVAIFSDIITTNLNLCYARTRTNSSVNCAGMGIIPVGGNRTLYVSSSSSNTGTYSLWVKGYRRIGLNG